MNDFWANLRYRWLYFNWKRRVHKRRGPNFKVGNLRGFFQALNDAGVIYVLLRWFDEIPLDDAAEAAYNGDLDIMVDSRSFRDFCRIVARFPGKIKIDMYSEGVQMGTGYGKLPYYPPPKAHQILENRVLYKNAFYVPETKIYLYSLCYHLVYHKGILSGLDFGLGGGANDTANKHPVQAELRRIAQEAGETLPENLTLFALHQWLEARLWNMPYDLLAHWGKPNEWHKALQKYEEDSLQKRLGGLHDILVFMIREDAVQNHLEELILQRLEAKFRILDKVPLSAEQQRCVMNETRGADWTKHKALLMIPPVTAVICYDPAPQPVPADSKLGKMHFNVRNNNVFYKHQLRAELDQICPTSAGNFLHSSDDDFESMAYMLAVYGEEGFDQILPCLLEKIGQ